ncbi:MAG: hypothetical protein JW866_06805 [Ignavibacteriales bacterium]|nr:hypothetical protein [Ignavibacteriales bacterium]
MKKFFIIIGFLIFFFSNTNAQYYFGAGFYFDTSIPLSNLTDYDYEYRPGYGFNAKIMLEMTEGFHIILSSGYTVFECKSYKDFSLAILPVYLGLRMYPFYGSFMPYLNVEGGLNFMFQDAYKSAESERVQKTKLGFGFGGGFLFLESEFIKLDLNILYNIINTKEVTSKFLSLRLGIAFGF